MSTRTLGMNAGHGHVYQRDDGIKARCGGPAFCSDCARDFVERNESSAIAQPAAKCNSETIGHVANKLPLVDRIRSHFGGAWSHESVESQNAILADVRELQRCAKAVIECDDYHMLTDREINALRAALAKTGAIKGESHG